MILRELTMIEIKNLQLRENELITKNSKIQLYSIQALYDGMGIIKS
jgi:hypothetical protein